MGRDYADPAAARGVVLLLIGAQKLLLTPAATAPGSSLPEPSQIRAGQGRGTHEICSCPSFQFVLLSLSFIYSSFHVSVFSLLHAMAVVLHADETVRGTTAGSHFSGNF